MSDTVTKPSVEMLNVMFNAKVGDDVYKQDPTVNELEETLADLFGMEAALFFPSGTMANQTAIKLHTQPGEQVICDKYSHIYHYEGGGASFNSGVSCCLVDGNRGMITADLVKNGINDPEFYHAPLTSLVSIENTTNKGGGACYDLQPLQEIKQVCIDHNLKYHLDGARLWNALVAKKQHPKQFGELFDTISVCLSKGLGAPVGSVLVCKKELEPKARRIRKAFGGGMRQAGFLAAAGTYALNNHITRLKEDHVRAAELGKGLANASWVKSVMPVDTNIVIFSVTNQTTPEQILNKLAEHQIKAIKFGAKEIRLVTHLDFDDAMLEKTIEAFEKISA